MPISLSPQWLKEYELNIECIDLQHRYFFTLIFKIARELRTTQAPHLREELVAELNAYARFHFISEENFMSEHGFPELTSHKFQHLALLDQLSAKQNALVLHANEQEEQAFVHFLFDWFVNHTTKTDRIFADYYHAKKSNLPTGN